MWKNPGQFEAFAKNFYGWTRDFGGLGDAHGDVQADLFSTNPKNIFSNGTSTIPLTDKSYTDAYANLRQVNLLLQKAESYSLPEGIKVPVGEAYFSELISTSTCFNASEELLRWKNRWILLLRSSIGLKIQERKLPNLSSLI